MPHVKRVSLKPVFIANGEQYFRRRARRLEQRNYTYGTTTAAISRPTTDRFQRLDNCFRGTTDDGGNRKENGVRWTIRVNQSPSSSIEVDQSSVADSHLLTSGGQWLLTPRDGGGGRRRQRRWESLMSVDQSPMDDIDVDDEYAAATVFKGKLRSRYDDGVVSMRVGGHSISSGHDMQRRSHKLRRTTNVTRHIIRFSIVVRLAILCRRLVVSDQLFRKNVLYEKIVPYLNSLQLGIQSTGIGNGELMFDRARFKANRRLQVSEETKKILMKPSGQRTEKDTGFIIRAMNDIKSFAELPIRMQNKVAEVARYERHETQKLIVMQHDRAHSVYFILAGSVVVLITEDDSSITRPVATMTRGMTFGELALINGSKRQSTIIVKEDVELMSIDLEDYHKIFMLGGTRNVTDPDHMQFLNGLNFLAGWPIERMSESTTKCIFHYFKRGEILIRNSQMSTWIIIVKSGSLNVLKKLKKVETADLKAYADQMKAERLHVIDDPLLRRREKRMEQKQNRSQGILPPITSSSTSQTTSSPPDEVSPPPSISYPDHQLDVLTPRPRQRRHAVATRNELVELSVARVLGGRAALLTTAVAVVEEDDEDDEVDETHINENFADVNRDGSHHKARNSFQHRDFLSVDRSKLHVDDDQDDSDGDSSTSSVADSHRSTSNTLRSSRGRNHRTLDGLPDINGRRFNGPTTSTLNPSFSDNRNIDVKTGPLSRPLTRTRSNREFRAQSEQETPDQPPSRLRTIADDIDSYKNCVVNSAELTDADFNPEFVHVQTLVRGQVFGLADVILGAQPSLSVLSNGAECILLDKQFYVQHAPEVLLRRLRFYECCPYPTDDVMQRKLLLSVQWAKYRQSTLNDVINERYQHRHLLDRTV